MIWKYYICMFFLPFVLSQNDVSSEKLIACKIPENFQVEVSNSQKVDIYNNELLIKYGNFDIYLYPDTTRLNIILIDSIIKFQAHMMETNFVNNSTSIAKKISWSSNGTIHGIGQLRETNKGCYQVQQYQFFLLMTSSESSNLLEAVEREILRLVQVCLKIEIEKNIKIIPKQYLNNLKKNDDSITDINEVSSCMISYIGPIEVNVNDLIDLAVGITIDMIKIYNLENIKLPNINEDFTSTLGAVRVKGQLQTFNGTFEGLTTLRRTADVILTRKDHKLTASCGFGISNVIVRINDYKFKYGFLNICGNILGTAENIALKAKISVDYNTPQCTTELNEMKITEFDNLEVKFTGLGLIDKIGPKLIRWFTKYLKSYLKGIIERELRNIVKELLPTFDCEKNRTKIILENFTDH